MSGQNKTCCKACYDGTVKSFISFGKMPLGNAFLREKDFPKERLFELELGLCQKCLLVQQTKPPPFQALKHDYESYAYVPFGKTLAKHYSELAQQIVGMLKVDTNSFVLDIGSNNGLLLHNIRQSSNCDILGIEPAGTISQIANDSDVPTITDFFTHDLAKLLDEYVSYDVICCTQVLQHIPTLRQFLADVEMLLKPNGVFVCEGRYFIDTLKKTSFDTVYPEMLYFFTLTSLQNILKTIHMQIFRAEINDIYGGSLLIYAKKDYNTDLLVNSNVSRILKGERPFVNIKACMDFAIITKRLRKQIKELAATIKEKGESIAGYGAPSTGTTLLFYCGLDNTMIDYIVDDNSLKQGLFTPGTHIPIYSSEALKEVPPNYLFIIAWRLIKDILQRITAHKLRGMKILIPLPKLSVRQLKNE